MTLECEVKASELHLLVLENNEGLVIKGDMIGLVQLTIVSLSHSVDFVWVERSAIR